MCSYLHKITIPWTKRGISYTNGGSVGLGVSGLQFCFFGLGSSLKWSTWITTKSKSFLDKKNMPGSTRRSFEDGRWLITNVKVGSKCANL